MSDVASWVPAGTIKTPPSVTDDLFQPVMFFFFLFLFFKVRAWKLKQTEGASRVCTSTKDSDPGSQSTSGSGSGSPAFIRSSGSHAVLLLNLIARRSSRRHKLRLKRSGLRLYTKVSDKWQRYLLVCSRCSWCARHGHCSCSVRPSDALSDTAGVTQTSDCRTLHAPRSRVRALDYLMLP